jgi:predicted alpha/beta-hydrolase family hydrolase
VSTPIGGAELGGREPIGRATFRNMRPARRLIKTEIVLPRSLAGRALVIGGLVVGGTVAVMMVALFTAFIFETVRTYR